MVTMKSHCDILDLFHSKEMVKIAAPMVRYSKLQFRTLLRSYDCDLCYTPMILADSFRQSEKARNNEFTTNLCDMPVITQFASNNVNDFVTAAKLVSPFCDGVDLNCGCPQRWAKQMGVGCVMLDKPELISDLVTQCTNQITKPFTVSVKMRILNNLQKTIEICRRLEKCGVSFLTVHGRTPSQLTGDVNVDALKLIVENVNCPVVANGGIKTLDDCKMLHRKTKCKGVMVANGLLTNPTLFTGSNETTLECVQNWINHCFNSTIRLQDYDATLKQDTFTIPERPPNLTFQCFHHHLVFMMEKVLPREKRRTFNNYQNFADVLEFLRDEFDIVPELFDYDKFVKYTILPLTYDCESVAIKDTLLRYDYDENDGKYFQKKAESFGEDECYGIGGMFIED